jgi:geranylgeranyl diphosphate synthase type I
MYAMGISAFLSINENMGRKEKALKKLIEAAIYTGNGEFLELTYGINDISKITKKQIYRVYDYKTAYYTFACPLILGAILAGATPKEIEILQGYGMHVGRAFQIKDDILGMFSEERTIGKSALSDLKEAKKTILIWYAFNNTYKKNKLIIKRILSKKNASKGDLSVMRKIIKESGSLDYARGEVAELLEKSRRVISSSTMKPQYKSHLISYTQEILAL